ncbi:hypothetical protein [Foetidibacter luteolus]|uniref:hypothetical protein n=1 Tax=Foetidibacter luteolus TaxID=2608880 RepID=UPI00129A4876|nr:hypothetical protein [Foetidibacter luteolus]
MQHRLLFVILILLLSCGTYNPVQRNYTFEDKQVFDLIERLKKDPADKEAATQLPVAYKQAADKRKSVTESKYYNLSGGDRYIELSKEFTVMQQMYEAIVSTPAAYKAVPQPWNPSNAIQNAKEKAAAEYYSMGMKYLDYNTRPYAQKAYDYFAKADEAYPGYKDVNELMNEARNLAILKVVVTPVNYYRNNFSYWGFQNDWLQDQLVRDLNQRSFRDVKFYTDWQANSQKIQPDKIVDVNFTNIYISQLFSNTYTINRSKQIQTGSTKSNPPQPIYTTVTATVYVTRRYLQSNTNLQCRIYDVQSNGNMFFDNFPNNYNWQEETARYRGDSRALTPQDWAMINNSNINPPGRSMIADRLLRNAYNMLINRINDKVRF